MPFDAAGRDFRQVGVDEGAVDDGVVSCVYSVKLTERGEEAGGRNHLAVGIKVCLFLQGCTSYHQPCVLHMLRGN